MSVSTAPSKWYGWGDPDRRVPLRSGALGMLRDELGEAAPAERVSLEEVGMPEARPLPAELSAALEGASVLTAHEQRLRRAAGKGYPDLVRLRRGRLDSAPDAVVLPGSREQVRRVLDVCAAHGIAVVPFGGGTSVVGGVEPVAGEFERLISLDLHRLRRVEVDERSLTARLGPGLRGPEAEAELQARGMTLGHFPQSFEYATIGGFAATRSAGQASSGYGRFDALVSAIELVAPTGELRTLETPHTAAGPALREVAVGSEGALGVITDVAVRVRRAPEARRYEGWIATDFREGAEIARELAQRDALPDVLRLSDEEETRVSLAMAGAGGLGRRLLDAYLGLRGRRGGCMLICGWEGERAAVERRHAVAGSLLRAGGALRLGTTPGRAWLRGRYAGPYVRDELIDLGYLVETLETAHTWSRLDELYAGVGGALAAALDAQGTPAIVMCHVSHVYRDGASLYFTFISRALPGEELGQWRAAKAAACGAIVAAGGTITHHHAVGRDHAPYMGAEVGETGLEVLRAVKNRLDPAGIMNPGKLLP